MMGLHLPAATHSYLERSAESLREAITCTDVPQRYALAHVAALRATAALLAEREADDLVRDADRFLALVETSLGLTGHAPFQVA